MTMCNCKDDNSKYSIGCPVLEGIECCKCCGIIHCKYDVCPADEKIHSKDDITFNDLTVLEYFEEEYNNISNPIKKFIKGKKISRHDLINAERSYLFFKNEINDEMFNDMTKNVIVKCLKIKDNAIRHYSKELNYMIATQLYGKKYIKKTTYYYIKKHINKFGKKSIIKNKFLTKDEKIELIKSKLMCEKCGCKQFFYSEGISEDKKGSFIDFWCNDCKKAIRIYI